MTEREARLLAAAQAFIDATRGSALDDAFIPWRNLRDALTAYPLQIVVSTDPMRNNRSTDAK